MKVLLYTEGLDGIKNSGLGKAIDHQIEALKGSDIEYTLDSNCTDYDVVHINFYNLKAYFFAKRAHKLGKKVIYHAHSTEEDFRNSFPFSNLVAPLFKKWIIKCYKLGDYIVTPTDYSKKLLEKYNLGRPIYSLSNGVNINFFEKNRDLGEQFRKQFGFTIEDKIIMGVGLYFERKGILDFVELAKRMPEYKFIWFGYNPPYMSPMKIRKALKTNLSNLYFPGYVEPEILRGAYSGADLFIFPTKEETEGIPILEAFTSKINTIVSNIPVFDWVRDKKEVYKANSINEFEELIKKIISNQLPSLVDNAYKCVNDKDIKNVGKQLISIYKGVYMETNKELIIKQQMLNSKLANLFKENGIKNFRLLSLGNSIGSGYSMVRTIKPLLLRNETLESIMAKSGIELNTHHFARAQNNNDEHIFEWIISNIGESKIHRLNINDYSDGPTSMVSHGLDSEKLNEYYPTDMKDDIGLQDAILESDDDMANIVIYNGCTGSFLDNVTRNGKLKHKLAYGINRDIYGLEATLKFIQTNNRNNNSNTQVYICGAPDFLGLKISEIINVKLKRIVKKYSNVVYVQPVKSKFFYKPLDISENADLEQAQSIFKRYLRQPDIHYDEEEYLEFNNNIIQSISDNYLIVRSMINIDRDFYNFSCNIESENQEMLYNKDYVQHYLITALTTEGSKLSDENSRNKFYERAKQYLIDRLPYDFHYTGKENINESLNETHRKK